MEELELLTPRQLAQYMHLKLQKVYAMLRSGEIPVINVSAGKKPVYRVPLKAYRDWQNAKIKKEE